MQSLVQLFPLRHSAIGEFAGQKRSLWGSEGSARAGEAVKLGLGCSRMSAKGGVYLSRMNNLNCSLL